MSKKVYRRVAILIFTIFLCGIAVIFLNIKQMQKSSYELSTIGGMTLSIVDDSVTDKSITTRISYNGEGTLLVGKRYAIEKYVFGNWYEVPHIKEGVEFLSLAYQLNAGDTKNICYDWNNEYGTLPAGKYRIVLFVSVSIENSKYQEYNVSVPFDID